MQALKKQQTGFELKTPQSRVITLNFGDNFFIDNLLQRISGNRTR